MKPLPSRDGLLGSGSGPGPSSGLYISDGKKTSNSMFSTQCCAATPCLSYDPVCIELVRSKRICHQTTHHSAGQWCGGTALCLVLCHVGSLIRLRRGRLCGTLCGWWRHKGDAPLSFLWGAHCSSRRHSTSPGVWRRQFWQWGGGGFLGCRGILPCQDELPTPRAGHSSLSCQVRSCCQCTHVWPWSRNEDMMPCSHAPQ